MVTGSHVGVVAAFSGTADAIESVVTALALIAGGLWSYARIIKNRTYHPRLRLSVDGGFVVEGTHSRVMGRVRVQNIGACKVLLLKEGTGLRLVPALESPAGSVIRQQPWNEAAPANVSVFRAQWLEPGESTVDEVLFCLPQGFAGPCKLEVRVVLRRAWRSQRLVAFTRRTVVSSDTSGQVRERADKDDSANT